MLMEKKLWNHNIRFSMTDDEAMQAWEYLHSARVKQDFKSQNAFVIAAINDFYKRHLVISEDSYLETREKEDAFAEKIVQAVEQKVLSNLPALSVMYQMQQQALLQSGLQAGGMAMTYAIQPQSNVMPVVGDATNLEVANTKVNGEMSDELAEPEENELLDFSFGE